MAQVDLIMPKMGESIMEATILNWVKKEGDQVDVDDTILEIATDKVDSEVPSPVAGTIKKILFQVDDVVPIGEVIAVIEVAAGAEVSDSPSVAPAHPETNKAAEVITSDMASNPVIATATEVQASDYGESERFYSPLVRAIAEKEHIGIAELDTIPGTGQKGRVTKKDMPSLLETSRQ